MSTVLFFLIFTANLGIGFFFGKNIERNSRGKKIPHSFERLLILLICIGCFCYIWVLATSFGKHMREKHDNDNYKTIHSSNVHCPMKVAIASDIGQLGNKFFEYLTSRFMADVLQSEIYITPTFAELYDKYFIGRSTPIIDWNYLDNRCSLPRSIFVTLPINYLPDLKLTSTFTPNYIKFLGFPVNITATTWEAIFSRRNVLIKEFQWRPEIRRSVNRKLAKVKSQHNSSTVVAVHARRTDYYVYLEIFYGTFKPANASYYIKAMELYRKKFPKPVFLIFSDDMDWCRENLQGNDIIYAGISDQNDPGFDLALMSSCDHLILSYGTYGMMAAWFNDGGEVISADNFTSRPEAMVETLKTVPILNWTWISV